MASADIPAGAEPAAPPTRPAPPASVLSPNAGTIVRWQRAGHAATRRLAFVGVLGMLIIGILATLDVVVFRAIFNAPLHGFIEILQTVFAVAIASVFASGLAERANLRVDLLSRVLGPRAERWLEVICAAALLLAFVLLAWQAGVKAAHASRISSQTVLLELPVYAFYWAIAGFLALCLPVQLLVLLESTATALTGTPPERSAPDAPLRGLWPTAIGVALALALAAFATIVVTSGLTDAARANPVAAALLVFLLLWVFVLATLPVGIALLFAGMIGVAILIGWDRAATVVGEELVGLLTNPELSLIPLFLMMGAFATTSGMSADIYRLAQSTFGARRGGLAMATVAGCAGFGALTGTSIATAATIGAVSLPEMRARGYAPSLATGCVAAGATLGQLVPPSTIIVLYAILVEASIGKLYIAILVPAALSIALYLAAIMILVRMRPEIAPGRDAFRLREFLGALKGGVAVMALFVLVIGGIYTGVFTATEAAAVGAVLTFAVTLFRGRLRGGAIWAVAAETTRAVALIYLLIVGALVMSFFMALSGLPAQLTDYLSSTGLAPTTIILILVAFFILLGTVMDATAVMIITAGVVAPLVTSLGYDPIWWGVMMVVLVEIGVVTPPFGINLFVLKSIDPTTPIGQIYRGVLPFVGADLVKIALLILFPALALWLPATAMP